MRSDLALQAHCSRCGGELRVIDGEWEPHYCVGPAVPPPAHDLGMAGWLATEGGRKCPDCGRYAKKADLGWIGLYAPNLLIDAWGHLPGTGCRVSLEGI